MLLTAWSSASRFWHNFKWLIWNKAKWLFQRDNFWYSYKKSCILIVFEAVFCAWIPMKIIECRFCFDDFHLFFLAFFYKWQFDRISLLTLTSQITIVYHEGLLLLLMNFWAELSYRKVLLIITSKTSRGYLGTVTGNIWIITQRITSAFRKEKNVVKRVMDSWNQRTQSLSADGTQNH